MSGRYFSVIAIFIIFLFSSILTAQTPPPLDPAPSAAPAPTPTPAPTPVPAATPAPVIVEATSAVPAVVEPSSATIVTPEPAKKVTPKERRRLKRVLAIFEIEQGGQPLGIVKAQLFVDKVPKTTASFIGLAEGSLEFKEYDKTKGKEGTPAMRPFYDGLTFHRVVPDFVVQGGCPFGTGRGGPGFTVPDEVHGELRHDSAGILSMAREGSKKDSGGSQFFFTLAPIKNLDGKYTVFGKVIEGLDIVKKMGQAKRDPITERPREALVMKKVSIVREYTQ